MSLFFGGGNKAKPQYTGLAVQTSASDLPIPIAIGRNRLSPNLLDWVDFKATEVKQGKGGGKGMTTYNYSASIDMGLCWGPLDADAVIRMWKDKSQATEDETPTFIARMKGGGWTFFQGTVPQDPWGYMTTNHPDHALGYPGIVHAAMPNYELGQVNSLGQHNFELKGLLYGTGIGGAGNGDADPALAIELFLTDPGFGVGFNMDTIANIFSTVDAPTTGDGTFQTYCQAIGFAISPFMMEQKAAGEYVERWAKTCNTATVFNGYQIKFHPWGDEEITGNGVTYVPDFPVRYELDDRDFIFAPGEDPVKVSRANPADQKNSLDMVIKNRANEYNNLPVPWLDIGLADQYGPKPADAYDAPEVTEISMAEIMVALIGQRAAYIRNTFNFVLPIKYCLLEPMDVVQITDPQLGVAYVLLRSVEETEEDTLEIEAEEYVAAIATSPTNVGQGVTNTPQNTLVESGPVNPPILFEPPSSLTGGKAQIWAAVSGGDGTDYDPNWGGAVVWISTDDINYVRIGEVDGPARMGKLTAALASYGGSNPDTVHTLSVDLSMSQGELSDEASASDAASGQNLCYIEGTNREFLSFEVPTLDTTYNYDLTRLWRKLYGSTGPSHSTGDDFAFLDENIFKYDLPADYIGRTLYLKFQSLNIYDTNPQDLADVTAYSYDPAGHGYGTGTDGAPAITTSVSGSAGTTFSKVTWTQNSVNDNATGYQIWRATGSSQPFGSATLIATVPGSASEYVDTAVTGGQAYTYFVVPINVVGSGPNSSGVNLTPTAASVTTPYGFAFIRTPVANKNLAVFDSPLAWTIPASLTDSQATIVASTTAAAGAPSAQTDFDLQYPIGTSVGTIRFAASSLVATFIKASSSSISLGSPVYIVCPASLNGITGDITGSIIGTR